MKTKLINKNYKDNWVNNLLIERGIPADQLDLFFHPSPQFLSEPDLLDNCTEAAHRIINAINNHEHIGLIVDSDMDGVCSMAIIYHYLHEINPSINITYFFHDGKQHGLEDSWEKFVEVDVDLILQPDSGINDFKYHELLKEHNINTIIMDHHEYEDTGFSNAAIYVDNQISPTYPNKSLAGCGVTWQVCRMIDKIQNTNYAFKYIDLVALGCSADVMSPLTLENRFIFDYGFTHIQDNAFQGLCDKQSYSMNGVVNYTSVAFYIAPLINACMRVGLPEEKLLMYKMFLHPERFVTSHKRGASGTQVSIIEEACRILTNVKARQQRLLDQYESIFEGRINEQGLDENNLIAIRLQDEDDFDSGLNGVIAMKIAAKYHKPCIIVRDGIDGLTKGSMRNPYGSPIEDLKALIGSSPYTNFALGHAQAAGCGIETASFDEFINWFNQQTSNLSFSENCYEVNFDITPNDEYVETMCYEIGAVDDIWGGDNPQPIIYFHNIHLDKHDIIIQGKNKDSIKFKTSGITCVAFRVNDLIDKLESMGNDIVIDLIGKANLNEWMGKVSSQILISDIEIKEDNLMEF